MFDRLDDMLRHYEELMLELNNPSVAEDQRKFRKLMKEQADLAPIVDAYKQYKQAKQDVEDSLALLDEESDEDAAPTQRPEEEPEREEQQHVERELQDREVGDTAGRAEIADEARDVEVDARAGVRSGVGERKQRVRPDGQEGDEGGRPEQGSAQRETPAAAIAHRDDRHEQRGTDEHAEADGDRRGIHLVAHASILAGACIAHGPPGA